MQNSTLRQLDIIEEYLLESGFQRVHEWKLLHNPNPKSSVYTRTIGNKFVLNSIGILNEFCQKTIIRPSYEALIIDLWKFHPEYNTFSIGPNDYVKINIANPNSISRLASLIMRDKT